MKREHALELIEHILSALVGGQAEWPLSLVSEFYVFGSVARGAIQPHDVDIDIEYKPDWRWGKHFADCLVAGRNPHSQMKRSLIGARRGCQFQFNYRDQADFDMTLLWRKGDPLDVALKRLHELRPDPAAGRAPRHAMLPQFEGIDSWVPRPHREILSEAVSLGAIEIERLVLSDEPVRSRTARNHIDERWSPSSPLRRAAYAVVAEWERRDIDPCRGHLHGEDIQAADTPYLAGFELRYFTNARYCFIKHGGIEWLEVVHPTRSRPIDCLRIFPVDLDALAKCLWGDYLDRAILATPRIQATASE